jgi:hypothetical protein
MRSELHSSRQRTLSQVQSASPSCSTRRRPWVLARLRRRSREANSVLRATFTPHRLYDALTRLTGTLAKLRRQQTRAKAASAPALGKKGIRHLHRPCRRAVWQTQSLEAEYLGRMHLGTDMKGRWTDTNSLGSCPDLPGFSGGRTHFCLLDLKKTKKGEPEGKITY